MKKEKRYGFIWWCKCQHWKWSRRWKQFRCDHDWQKIGYISLSGHGGNSRKCNKCEKWEH